ncbi:N-methyl-L-tryptophan oxidase [Microvirga tunisiensis]|jgi:sarcosine oxidase|uniref:N-methyl-L-tryptophan oxidase n=1 Tax=Microvirga tunisiensis TaxID=2108360 RepID=A0A5N7ME73_9HYPH|nr:N-methyl-L-tryptophan oxidase [Microvirga tunisiensis]MPR06909.1 N-methyl-L-tryptophan oxidase [Microvirga tunisiensis]MPR25077.1 N-methyl-L-tryptophan oxidase [Microvirga tunisiensis]
MTTFDVAVIGLGAMGSAALFNLARQGRRVIGIEQFEPGHDKGSSHGESRIIRLSYFEHPSYVPLARRAMEKWRELEQLCRHNILTVTGVLEAGYPGCPIVEGSLEASRLHGLDHEVLSAAEINRRFPAFKVPPHWTGLYQPEGGFLRPELAIQQFVGLAERHGAEVRTGTRVLAIEPLGSGVRVRTEAGEIEAGSVIVAAGAWIGDFAPELKPHLKLTRQVLGWFEPLQPAYYAPDRCPVFILESEDDACYGFPDFAGTGVKTASHRKGAYLPSADDLSQDGGAADEAQIRRMLALAMPEANGPLRAMRTCMYTRTPDEDFVIDRSSADPRIILASPCSGHGFKFASVIGEVLADLALGKTPANDISRFKLERFRRQSA